MGGIENNPATRTVVDMKKDWKRVFSFEGRGSRGGWREIQLNRRKQR
jgi:hypothetical protein